MKRPRSKIWFSLPEILIGVTLLAVTLGLIKFAWDLKPDATARAYLHDRGASLVRITNLDTGESYYQLELLSEWRGEPEDLLYLEALNEVAIVRMHGTPGPDEHLEVLARLDNVSQKVRELSLVDSDVSDRGLEHVADWPALLVVDLSGTKLDGDGLRHLRASRGLQILKLDRAQFSDASIPGLAALDQVQELSMRESNVTEAALASIGKMKSLRELDLTSTPGINGSGLGKLRHMPNLEFLRLSQTNVSGDQIGVLAEFPKLREVMLDRTPVTRDEANALRKARPALSVGN